MPLPVRITCNILVDLPSSPLASLDALLQHVANHQVGTKERAMHLPLLLGQLGKPGMKKFSKMFIQF